MYFHTTSLCLKVIIIISYISIVVNPIIDITTVLWYVQGMVNDNHDLELVQTLLPVFSDRDDSAKRRAEYLQNRYMGFSRTESRKLVGVSDATVSIWRRNKEFKQLDDIGVARVADVKKEIVQFNFLRNLHLVMTKDQYVLKKANGLLEEKYVDFDDEGRAFDAVGSPPMDKDDWDYFHRMRRMYTLAEWNVMEKLLKGEEPKEFNINQLILNQDNRQVNYSEGHAAIEG